MNNNNNLTNVGGGSNSLSIIRSLTQDIHVNIFNKILNNSFDGLFPSDYYTRMNSTWNALDGQDWSTLQNNISGSCKRVAWNSGSGDNFSYVDLDKSRVYNGAVYLIGWVYSQFRPMFEIKD